MEKMIVFFILFQAILALKFHKRLRGKAYFAPIIPLLIAAGTAAAQGAQAAKQKKAAAAALNYMPPALVESQNLSRLMLNATKYPGQDLDESRVRQGAADSFANASRATRSSGDLLNAAAGIDAGVQRQNQTIAKTGLGFRMNALDKYRGLLGQVAGQQNANRSYSENLKGAAARNNYNAVQSLGGGVAAAATQNDWNKTYGKNTPMMPMGYGNMMGGGGYMMNPNRSSFRWNPYN